MDKPKGLSSIKLADYEYTWPKPTRESTETEPLSPKNALKNDILWLNVYRWKGDEFDQEIKGKLTDIDSLLGDLEKKNPDDHELTVLRRLYDDLFTDDLQGKDLELDSGFEALAIDAAEQFEKKGMKVESLEETRLKALVAKLQALDINPEYVVDCGKKNAKTIVYFMQIHPMIGVNPSEYEEEYRKAGIWDAQDEIERAINAAVDVGLIDSVYGEGLFIDKPVDPQLGDAADDPAMSFTGYVRAKNKHGDKLELIGMESLDLITSTLRSSDLYPRMTAHNMILADNVVDHFKKSGAEVSFAVLGGGHEMLPNLGHTLPFSRALALNGVNVIVVDEAKVHILANPEIRALFESIIEKERVKLEKERAKAKAKKTASKKDS